jgi:type I restriction enzyme S subunit
MSIPAYPAYRDSGVAWLEQVPAHWEVMPLKRAACLCTDRAADRSFPVGLEHIESWTGRLIEAETEFEGDGVAFRPGDILFGKLRPYLAKAWLADRPGEAVGDFHVIRPLPPHMPAFLQRVLLSPEAISLIDGSTYGSKMPRASWEFIGSLAVPIPPPAEQRAIAAFLDRECGKIDALVAEQERLIALLKEKRQAVISHAVTKGLDPTAPMKDSGVAWLGQVPAHWEVRRLGTLFVEAADEGEHDLPVLSVSIHDGVSDRELPDEELERKVTRSDNRSKYKKVQPGDLVYNMMRAWQGGFGTVAVPGMVSPAYVVARPKTSTRTAFVELLLRTPCAVEEMRRHSRGVTDFRLRLYWEEFKDIKVVLPPLEEQNTILGFIEAETKKLDTLTTEAERAIALLKERRAALISAAVTGRIDVRGLAPAEEAKAA